MQRDARWLEDGCRRAAVRATRRRAILRCDDVLERAPGCCLCCC
jgi:hypothetical protein